MLSGARKLTFVVTRLVMISLAAAFCVAAEQLPIKTYSIADGLARDYINRIKQDSHGYIWFCTTEGISRFDGYVFVNYGVAEGLPHRVVSDMLETRGGEYLFATQGGVVRLNVNRTDPAEAYFTYISLGSEDDATRAVIRLTEDPDGTIWVGSAKGLFHLSKSGDQWVPEFIRIEITADKPTEFHGVNTLMIDRDKSLWVGTAALGVFHRRPDGGFDRFTEADGLTQNGISDIYQDLEGRIWVGTGTGLTLLTDDPKPGQRVAARGYHQKDGLLTEFVETIFQSSDGQIWIGTRGGLNVLVDPAVNGGRAFRGYTPANGLRNVRMISITEDTDNNLWIGAESGGALKMPLVGFTSYFENDGLGTARITQILNGANGSPYVLTIRSGDLDPLITRFDGQGLVNETPNLLRDTSMSWGWNQLISYDKFGEWWIGTASGIFRFAADPPGGYLSNALTRNKFTIAEGMDDNYVFRLFEDANGDVWFSTLGSTTHTIVHRWVRKTGKIEKFDRGSIINSSAVTAFENGPDGSVWMGMYSGGLLRYQNGTFAMFTEADGVPAGFVRHLFLDSKSRLWICTSIGGVGRMDDLAQGRPGVITMTTADGLSSDQVTTATEDKFGRIYLGTGRGIDRLDPDTRRIRHFTTAEGLADNFVNVSNASADGTLWFGTLRGLSRFIPSPDKPRGSPTVFIKGITINGKRQPLPELGGADINVPDLGPEQNQLEIEFVSVAFAAGERLSYQFKFGGSEADWSEPSQQRKITLPNLGAGKYSVEVRAINSDGIMSEQPARVTFRILSPFYYRWWFIAIVALFVVLVAFGSYSYRTARLREVNVALEEARLAEERLRKAKEERLDELEAVRSRIATDLHDDIGASLTQIAILSEVAQAQNKDKAAAKPLSRITEVSNELVGTMSDIVWSINPAKDHVSDLAQRMRRFAADILASRSIKLHFNSSQNVIDSVVRSNVRREAFLIFKESINNVIKHSGASNVWIDLSVDGGELTLTIRDDGTGFDPSDAIAEGNGNGLASMRRRTKEMGGSLEIRSAPGSDTSIIASFPVEV